MTRISFVLSILFIGGSSSQNCDCSCGNGWVTYGDSCYLFSNAAGMHYVEAKQYRQQHYGAHLVSIETASENAFLRDYAARMNDTGRDFWLGLTDEMIESVWRWGSVGEKAGYTDWYPGQPDDTAGAEDCAVLQPEDQYHWNDVSCVSKNRPLCEKINCDGVKCCPDTWVTYEGSCYLFNTGNAFTFNESQYYCKQHGGDLLSIETSQENIFLKDFIGRLNTSRFWIGLSDAEKEGTWKWVASGQTTTFTNWYPGEPNGGGENCAEFFGSDRAYTWNDVTCRGPRLPLCEKRKLVSVEVIGR